MFVMLTQFVSTQVFHIFFINIKSKKYKMYLIKHLVIPIIICYINIKINLFYCFKLTETQIRHSKYGDTLEKFYYIQNTINYIIQTNTNRYRKKYFF